MQSADRLLDMDVARLSGLHGDWVAAEACHLLTVGIYHLGLKRKSARFCVLVPYLTLGMDDGLVGGDIEVGSIDVGARRT